MKLSKRGEYGLRAMVNLASQPPTVAVVQIKEIAQREQIPLKFLEQILLTLKNAGLLQSRMGAGGGYSLARPADQITLGQIVRVLDGPLAPIRCVSKMAYQPCACPDEETCGLRLVMLDVRNAISDILDRTTLADVARRVEQARGATAPDRTALPGFTVASASPARAFGGPATRRVTLAWPPACPGHQAGGQADPA